MDSSDGGLPVLELPGSNVICPDIFYNVDTSKYYATAAVTPYIANSPEKYYGTFRMWEASDADFQTSIAERDLLICNADTLPLMEDWENGGNYDGQHFIWPDVYNKYTTAMNCSSIIPRRIRWMAYITFP